MKIILFFKQKIIIITDYIDLFIKRK